MQHNSATTTDVLIVGAGPVGLSLALALRHYDLRIRIVDRAPATKHEARAAIVWPRCAEIFDDLGCIDSFKDAAYALESTDVYANGERLGQLDVGHVASAHPHPLVIEQHVTERLLADALARRGVQVEFSTELSAIQVFEDRAEAILRRGDGMNELVTSAWLIGCDGARSQVRQQLGIPFEGKRRANLQVVQINAIPSWHYADAPSHGYFFLAANASLGCFSRPGGGYRFFCFTTDPDPSRTAAPTVDEMRELIAAVAYAPELTLTPTDPPWTNRARFQDRIAATLRRGRAFVVGDAAHVWAPIGGHGMNTGIRGAHNLAWKLAAVHRGEARPLLLDTYSDEQRASAQAVIDEMRFNILERPNGPLLLPLLRTLMPVGLASASIRRQIEWTLSDLAMHYRQSKLAWHYGGRQRLRAGDRVPDVAVFAEHTFVSLHRLLSMQQWTLLVSIDDRDESAVERTRAIAAAYRANIRVIGVRPQDHEAQQALGHPDSIILVRPDRHIGLLTRRDDLATLERYLDTFLIRAA
jgi:2-polyprenyl-6-methoxyphenol hydroxylase-like FAD-dependent oxidoreductase